MQISEFDFVLPPELIAKEPILGARDQSRLLVVKPSIATLSHHRFFELPTLLQPGDLLVMNNSKVFPARLIGKKETGGRVEFLLVRALAENAAEWEVMIGGKVHQGIRVKFDDSEYILSATIGERLSPETWSVTFNHNGDVLRNGFERLGQTPIPPYAKGGSLSEEALRKQYQTVYATEEGSTAAPTAGLHFTPQLLKTLHTRGIQMTTVTLHVGLGTFLPVKVEQTTEHKMHAERAIISAETATLVNRAKQEGRRIIAVGTTSVRTLESFMENGKLQSGERFTDIFITPGFPFQCIDAMITNFHLPKSTLLMLVSAFAGRECILRAYQEAIQQHYRFYSFGDAMLIL
ncbi:MAG: tRNA preQ1(34) S-adenosylmethionine ribosyltransferase-isomerase QueA [Candidatus Kerfeldbacteria bacterium]|nr:tRNA preQ1(34) S-adenosylmethionine ribosyltransferase-isomerase QueA [Candidatus Kerfeldbacteria bacterium]